MNKFFEPTHAGRHLGYVLLFFFLIFNHPEITATDCPETLRGDRYDNFERSFNFRVDIKALKKDLSGALSENDYFEKGISVTKVTFPLPTGKKSTFQIVESPVMSPEGEKLYDYKSYLALHPKTGEKIGRFSVSKNGLNGIFEDEENRLFSIHSIDNSSHRSGYSKGFLPEGVGCETGDISNHKSNAEKGRSDFRYGDRLRNFRIAVTNRGELFDRAQLIGQHLPTVLADYVNQVNFILEKELSVRFQVVTPIRIFTDKNTDPFPSSNTFDLIQKSRVAIDSLYAGYDYHLGHLFGYFGGGRAYLSSVCGVLKSGAVTGMDLPLSSPFLRLFAHEIGHQFGAGHSFNSDGNFCGQNLFVGSAYEIGSGSTLMSYAGSCVGENVEPGRSAFFNSGALEEINSFIQQKIVEGCGFAYFNGNQSPNVNAGVQKTIPARTPFFLEGTGNDPNGDPLTFSWEQHDLGPIGLLGNEAAVRPSVPLFRVFDPVDEPIRYFPTKDSVLYNENRAVYEILPAVSRNLKFYFTGRDNRGGVACDDVQLTVHDTGQSFKINSFNQPKTFTTGSTTTLFWNVAGTNQFPILTNRVDILMSKDGGKTFPISLARNTANDGAETITFPNEPSDSIRIMVRAEGNYFFDINDANIKIEGNAPPPQTVLELNMSATPPAYRQWSNVVFWVDVKNNGTTAANNLKIRIPTIPGKLVFAGSTTAFGSYNSFFEWWDIPRISAGGTATLTLTFFTLVKDEVMEVTASQQGGNLSKTVILRPEGAGNLLPDLFLNVTDSPSEADPGAFLSANMTIENIGTDVARGDYMIGIYFSENQFLDGADLLLGSISTGNTPVGSLPTAGGFFAPSNQAPGDYFLIYFIDNQQVISELNEGNNIVNKPFKINGNDDPPPPDCNITSIISQKTCSDNGTPGNPDDDLFTFNIQFLKPNNQTGNFRADVGNITRQGVYGGVYAFGPYSIADGAVEGRVEDLLSPNCLSDFTVTPTATCSEEGTEDYCESKSDFPWHEWIARVSFAGRQNDSGKSPYTDFSTSPITVAPGQPVAIELTAGFSWFTADEYFRVWLDSNRDGNFSGNEILFEKILSKPSDGTPTASVSGNVTIPISAKNGMTKMRVSMKKDGFPNPCDNVDFGEIEDYMVIITGQ